MKLRLGGQLFVGVEVPLLWGSRAVLQDQDGRLSILDLAGPSAVLEVVEDGPAEGAQYVPTTDGFAILGDGGVELYQLNPTTHALTATSLSLPQVTISPDEIRVGSSVFRDNTIEGFGVGILVTETGFAIGAPLPSGLAKLLV
jgi:hypothetical protein